MIKITLYNNKNVCSLTKDDGSFQPLPTGYYYKREGLKDPVFATPMPDHGRVVNCDDIQILEFPSGYYFVEYKNGGYEFRDPQDFEIVYIQTDEEF